MTTRRDIVTGLVAMPIAAMPAFTIASPVEAEPIKPPLELEFLHAIDHSIF